MKDINDIVLDLYETRFKLQEVLNKLERIHYDILEIRDKEASNGRKSDQDQKSEN